MPYKNDSQALLARLELAIEGSGFGIWEFDLNQQKLIWDQKMHDIYGFESGTFSGSVADWKKCILPEDIQVVDAKFMELMSGKRVELFEFRIRHHQTQETHYIEANGIMQFKDGTPGKLVGMNRDITEKKKISQDLENERAARTTAMKLAALGEMAGGVAHEINNPLAIIGACAAKLEKILQRESKLTPDLSDTIKRIDTTVHRIAKIVKGLLRFSGQSKFDNLEPTLLQDIFEEIVSISSERFRKHGMDLQCQMPAEPVTVMARSFQLSQVLLNLLNNSFDAIENQEQKWVRVQIQVLPDQSLVQLKITDSGHGLSCEVRNKLMQPFFTTKPVGRGTGLGLSLSRTIMRDHGGDLAYDSTSPNTCFVMTLPFSR